MDNHLTPGECVAANVRQLRGATLAQLSAQLEAIGQPMSVNTLSKIERGVRPVSVDELDALARALSVSTTRLMTHPDLALADSVQAVWEAYLQRLDELRYIRADAVSYTHLTLPTIYSV